MAELDLIPASYRDKLKVKRWLRQFGLAMGLLIISVAVTRFAILNSTKSLTAKIEVLQKNKELHLGLQQQHQELEAEETKLKKDLEILAGLQGGPSVRQILLAVDRVMQNGLWFTRWTFSRAREVAPAQPGTAQAGYFIVVPIGSENNAPEQSWKLTSHMEMSGQALDHGSLSNFVYNLIRQPEIADVKVLNTNLSTGPAGQVVDFKIAVVVNNQFKDKDG